MNNIRHLACRQFVCVALALCSAGMAAAQSTPAAKTRAQVKAEAAASNKGTLDSSLPQGQSSTTVQGQPNGVPQVRQNTRADVRRAAAAANANSQVRKPEGEGATVEPKVPGTRSAKTRSQVRQSAQFSRSKPAPGAKGERLDVPTNPVGGGGTPN